MRWPQSPHPILRWYRRLIAKKYDGSAHRGRGRPTTPKEIAELVVRMAEENPGWGYTRIRGALANLGHEIGRNTVKRILQDHGIEPAPERCRRMPWKTFLAAHWGGIAAADLFTVEVLSWGGLRRYFVLLVIELNAERFVRSIKEECLSRVVLIGERHLRLLVHEYVEHYHRERNHQGLNNELITPSSRPADLNGAVQRRGRIGGLLNCYYREAA